MLSLYILQHLMDKEVTAGQVSGRLTGWSLAWMQKHYGIPKSTFYRTVNTMLEQGWIVRQKRGYYVLSQGFRSRANMMKNAGEIRV